ncbi:hypothetical protein Q8F55_004982 [Vanrija albida]|uniref:DUF1279 domain-containing protein n=1 Tax=Vanrija albida TaxID=181172 RepID=A0ABR3Q0N7_9TREE
MATRSTRLIVPALALGLRPSAGVLGLGVGARALARTYSAAPTPPPRPSSSPPPSSPPPPSPPAAQAALSPRLQRYAPRLSALAQRTGVPLPALGASFLVLHELTAVLPVVGLYYAFSALGAGAAIVGWLVGVGGGDAAAAEHWADGAEGEAEGGKEGEKGWTHTVHGWYAEGLARAERVGRRYGLFGYEKGSRPGSGEGEGSAAGAALANAVAAYVVVKALLPVRIAVSVAAAPAFARLALRPWRALTARLRRSK